MALSNIGVGKEIQNIETDDSEEARACRRWYKMSREVTLRDLPWRFASKTAALALVEEKPDDEWAYSYRYPPDCVSLRRILGAGRNPGHNERIPYDLRFDDAGSLVYTDQQDAVAEYTARVTDTMRYPADFALAQSWRLSYYVVPRVVGSGVDTLKLRLEVEKQYQIHLSKAARNSMNEFQRDPEPASELERARN